jgi:AsmA protein
MRRKRTVIIVVAAVLLVVGAVLALPWIIDVNRYRGAIEAAAERHLGRQVTLGPMRLSVLPLGVRVENASIGEDPSFATGRPFAQVKELYVSPRFFALIRGAFELRSLELIAPEIELVRGDRWNFSTIGANRPSPAPDSQAGDSEFVLSKLRIRGGQIAVTDLRSSGGPAGRARPESRTVYKNIDLEVDDFAPARRFQVALGVTIPGEDAGRLSARGEAGPLVKNAVAMTPFDGSVELDRIPVAGALRFLALEALDRTDALISGSADVKNRDGLMTSTGSMRLEDARARGVALGYPIVIDFDVAHDANQEVLTIKDGRVKLDKTPVSLTGTVGFQSETPALDLRLAASDASLAEAARLAAAFGVAFAADARVDGRANVDVRARGAADAPALDGRVNLRNVSISGGDIKQPVRTAAIDLTLTPTDIRSNEFTIASAGTTVAASVALAQYTSASPMLDARIRTNAADLGDLLNAARAWGAGVDGMSGTGRLTLDVHARGPLKALTYTGQGLLADATLRNASMAEPLRIRTASLTFDRDAAVLDKLAAGIGTTNLDGRVAIRTFASPNVDFQLSADRIDVREMQRLLTPAQAPAPKAKATTAPAARTDGVFTRTTGTGRLRVGTVAYDRLILEDVAATVTLDHGLVRLNPVTAALFGGRHQGAIDVDARRTPVALTVASTIEKVDANRLASAVTSLKDVVFGSLGARVRMNMSGDDADSVARSMNGTLSMDLSEGRIANMNLRQEVARVARFVTGEPQVERTTRLAALAGDFNVTGGVARTDNLTGSIEGGTLGATGAVGLADQSVDLRLTAVLSSETSQRVGGSRVGGFLSTVLANDKGELVVPLRLTGTLAQPRFAPDVERVAEMKLKNLVPSVRNPQSATSRILGAIGGSPAEGETSGKRKSLGDIIGSVTGRTPPPAAPTTPEASSGEPKPEQKAEPKPAEKKDATQQVEEALRDLLRRRKPEQKPAEPAPTPQK